MQYIKRSLLLFFILFAMIRCADQNDATPTTHFDFAQQYAINQIDSSIYYLSKLSTKLNNQNLAKSCFRKIREHYKKAEPFAIYVNYEAAHHVNGPPLPVYREDSGKILPAVGLQAIGEQVYGEIEDKDLLKYQINITHGFLELLKKEIANTPITPKRFFVATHRQLLSIISLSITGFDTPTSLLGLQESQASLESFKEVYNNTLADTIRSFNPELNYQFDTAVDQAIYYLKHHQDFDSFNRFEFIRSKMNPITLLWVQIRQFSQLWEDDKTFALNFDAPTFFESNSFNIDNFRSTYNRKPSEEEIDLGKQLFFDPRLSKAGKLSCASCHNPQNAYTDGRVTALGNNGIPVQRNTPTLLNSIYQRKFFWDGRSSTLEEQISSVFLNKNEFNSGVHQISAVILEEEEYQERFKAIYGKLRKDNTDIIKALAGYVSTLASLNSKFDRNMRNEEYTFTDEEIEGMNLFMGKALCATCHFVPLLNGSVPPVFSETEKEILGTPANANNARLDDDPGFYIIYKEDIHNHMFKTPTLRNVALTAPYMHNGVYDSLEQVMDFYEAGGGKGLGFNVEYQTLPFDSLQLTYKDKKAIIAFMKTLTDPLQETYN